MQTSRTKDQSETSVIGIVHFADPWCWWSWGLEPVLRRLKEVYGDQVKITYRMGGISPDMNEWRKAYDIVDKKALMAWINESLSITKMPTDPEYILKTRVESTWPACIAFKAAQLQSEDLAERFFRRLMETIQVEAKNGSKKEVYLKIAEEVGLDASKLTKDVSSGKAKELFENDMKAMDVNFLTFVLVNKRSGETKTVGEVFTSDAYEKAIDQLTGGVLRKKTPVDILDYLERHRQNMISAREVAEVFGISNEDAEKRLAILSKGGLLGRREFDFGGVFWTAKNVHGSVDTLTMEQLNAAHITSSGKASSETEIGRASCRERVYVLV